MKKTCYLLATIAIVMLLSSCGDKTKINSRLVTKLYNEKAADLCQTKKYVPIDTGYYELNDLHKRIILQKLAHAGIIEYTVERYAWYDQCVEPKERVLIKYVDQYCEATGELKDSIPIYGTGFETSFTYEEHFMVNVRIARKYKSKILEKEPVPIDDRDMILPEYHFTPEDLLENNEVWEEIEKPKPPRIPHEREMVTCKRQTQNGVAEASEQDVRKPSKTKVIYYPLCEPMDTKTAEKYEEALERAKKGTVKLLGYEIKAVKARRIVTYRGVYDSDSVLMAKCEVILKSTNVTPQGHIINNYIINDIPAMVKLKLFYTEENGWEIYQDENNKFPEPQIDPSDVIGGPSSNSMSSGDNTGSYYNSGEQRDDFYNNTQQATNEYRRNTSSYNNSQYNIRSGQPYDINSITEQAIEAPTIEATSRRSSSNNNTSYNNNSEQLYDDINNAQKTVDEAIRRTSRHINATQKKNLEQIQDINNQTQQTINEIRQQLSY